MRTIWRPHLFKHACQIDSLIMFMFLLSALLSSRISCLCLLCLHHQQQQQHHPPPPHHTHTHTENNNTLKVGEEQISRAAGKPNNLNFKAVDEFNVGITASVTVSASVNWQKKKKKKEESVCCLILGTHCLVYTRWGIVFVGAVGFKAHSCVK